VDALLKNQLGPRNLVNRNAIFSEKIVQAKIGYDLAEAIVLLDIFANL